MSGGEGLEAIFSMPVASHFEMVVGYQMRRKKSCGLEAKRRLPSKEKLLKSIDHSVKTNNSNFDTKDVFE